MIEQRFQPGFLVGAVALLATSFFGAPVAAQEGGSAVGGVDVQTFRPAIGPGSLTALEGSETAGHLQPYGSLFFDYFSDPLVLVYEDGQRESVIDNRFNAHMALGLGLWDRFQVELGVPVVMVNDGSYQGQTIAGGGPGDLQVRAKGSLLSSRDNVVGLAAAVDLSIPTGRSEAYLGSPGVTASPMAVVDTRLDTGIGELLLATNLGGRLRGSDQVHDVELGSEFRYGAGAQLAMMPEFLNVGLEFFEAVDDASRTTNPLELLATADVAVMDDLWLTAGAGSGLVGGIGSPQWRGVFGVVYQPTFGDVDGDEALVEPTPDEDSVECPPEPEGFSGEYDDDGCAITPESFAGCASLFDDFEGPTDEWGCPMLDADGDGLVVWDDDCPQEPTEFIAGDNGDGCPNVDIDDDGIENTDDACPQEPGISRFDGCPPPEEEESVVRTTDEIEISGRVHFESDKAIIKPESFDLLEEVALVIRNNPDILLVEVAGHTDQRGDEEYNVMLSQERADAVREFLIERGQIPPARLDARGYGMSEPIVDEDSDEAMAENRRVEFRIMETGDESADQ